MHSTSYTDTHTHTRIPPRLTHADRRMRARVDAHTYATHTCTHTSPYTHTSAQTHTLHVSTPIRDIHIDGLHTGTQRHDRPLPARACAHTHTRQKYKSSCTRQRRHHHIHTYVTHMHPNADLPHTDVPKDTHRCTRAETLSCTTHTTRTYRQPPASYRQQRAHARHAQTSSCPYVHRRHDTDTRCMQIHNAITAPTIHADAHARRYKTCSAQTPQHRCASHGHNAS
jgi:hypothetical protein